MDVRVKVRQLQRGDYLLGSKQTVVSVGYSPMSGTKAVVLKREGAKEAHTAIWNANTEMLVRRTLPGEAATEETDAR